MLKLNDSKINLICSMIRHRDYLREGMHELCYELNRRAIVHDLSKWKPDEFGGFTQINHVARECEYGSEEYKESMKKGKPTIDLHFSRNSHHPEYHRQVPVKAGKPPKGYEMGFLDIIEMVIDWRAAWKGYESGLSWDLTIQKQRERFQDKFSKERWWLIEEVCQWVEILERSRRTR